MSYERCFDASLIGPLRFVIAWRRSRRSSPWGVTEFGRSSHADEHKFKEGAYFRRRQMPRREVRIELKTPLRPIRENLDQFAAFQQRIKTEGEALRDAVPSRAGIELGGKVVDNQPAADLDLDHLAAAMELPWERPPGYRIAEQQAFVLHEVLWVLRPAVAGQVG